VTGPRARLQTPPAGRAEWESQVLPAYARRMRQVNAADLAARGVRAPQLCRLNLEFRRRVKTQGSLPSQDAVLALLFGLVATGRIVFRKLDGWQDMVTGLTSAGPKAEEAA